MATRVGSRERRPSRCTAPSQAAAELRRSEEKGADRLCCGQAPTEQRRLTCQASRRESSGRQRRKRLRRLRHSTPPRHQTSQRCAAYCGLWHGHGRLRRLAVARPCCNMGRKRQLTPPWKSSTACKPRSVAAAAPPRFFGNRKQGGSSPTICSRSDGSDRGGAARHSPQRLVRHPREAPQHPVAEVPPGQASQKGLGGAETVALAGGVVHLAGAAWGGRGQGLGEGREAPRWSPLPLCVSGHRQAQRSFPLPSPHIRPSLPRMQAAGWDPEPSVLPHPPELSPRHVGRDAGRELAVGAEPLRRRRGGARPTPPPSEWRRPGHRFLLLLVPAGRARRWFGVYVCVGGGCCVAGGEMGCVCRKQEGAWSAA